MCGKRTLILGIESTAHTFGVSIIDENFNILADERSVLKVEAGSGIHPQKAAEFHSKNVSKAILTALREANCGIREISGIAYSAGPGLGPVLRIGATTARALACYFSKPIYPVHHAIGHIELAVKLTNSEDPLVVLVSGGHTAITAFNSGRWRIYGETLDITLGNLIDQFAREIGLPFPGGPYVEKLALKAKNFIELPYSVKGNNVMYSGLLTQALKLSSKFPLEDLCFSLQETAFSMLVEATERALVQLDKKEIVLTGGVASNRRLKEMMEEMAKLHGVEVKSPPSKYNPDNGVQIAIVGLYLHKANHPTPIEGCVVKQRWRLDEVDVVWRK